MEYSIEDIAGMTGAKASTLFPCTIKYVLTDSRSVSFPEETLFFAIKTYRNDGHKYIPELYRAGVRSFVISHTNVDFSACTEANFLQVNDTVAALQLLAAHHRERFSIPILGITGSNGKTIVKEWLYQLLSPDIRVTRSPRSYNSQIGVPLSVLMLDKDSEMGIFEAGISQPGEMEHLEQIIRPSVGLLTNVGEPHQENFSSMQVKAIEKCQLFRNSRTLIYCADDLLISRAVKMSGLPGKLFYWSQKNPDAPVYIRQIGKQSRQTCIVAVSGEIEYEVLLPFMDDASIENAINCLTFLIYNNYDQVTIASRMALLEPVAMRLEVKEGKNNCLLIDDTYNSDLKSLEIALDFQLRRLVGDMSRTVILSDILQSGMEKEELYGKVAHLLEGKQIDRLIGIGPDISSQASLFKTGSLFFTDTDAFLNSHDSRSLHNEIVLVKGARAFHFERIFEQLSHKVHETVLEVNLNNLIDNFNYYRSKLNPQIKVIAMVKAFAYGAGYYEVAKTLQEQHCDYLAVAVADEGAELRKAGIYMPLMVMNPEMGSFSMLFEHALEPEIYNFRLLKAMIEAAQKLGIVNYPVHLKLDTGMHRLGFTLDDIPEIIALMKKQNALVIRSVFSHLAGSDESLLDGYTKRQIEIFTQGASQIEQAFEYKIFRHILNTAGIERFPGNQMDMVRLGIGLYGVSSNQQEAQVLKNVSTLRTTILQIRELQAGETVGYGRKGKITRPSRIAVIPIGYADGLNRRLSNGNGEVWVNGKRVPIIGNICMDLTMIDITDVEANEGDTVIIFGKELPVSEIAQKLDTISYEVFTSVSARVKRIYYQE